MDRSCRTGKLAQHNWQTAERICHRMNKEKERHGHFYAPYVCKDCGEIHIGGSNSRGYKQFIRTQRRRAERLPRRHWRFLIEDALLE